MCTDTHRLAVIELERVTGLEANEVVVVQLYRVRVVGEIVTVAVT